MERLEHIRATYDLINAIHRNRNKLHRQNNAVHLRRGGGHKLKKINNRDMEFVHWKLCSPPPQQMKPGLSLAVLGPDCIGSSDSFGKSIYILQKVSLWPCSRLSLLECG